MHFKRKFRYGTGSFFDADMLVLSKDNLNVLSLHTLRSWLVDLVYSIPPVLAFHVQES
jgi:hypothetical protein